MLRGKGLLAAGALLTALTGCASYPLVGSNTTSGARVFGSFGITGHNNNFTVQAGSKISYLKIAGNGNTVTVEDGVLQIYRVEFWGQDNVVSIPFGMCPVASRFGHNNQVITRPPHPVARPFRLDAMDGDFEEPIEAPAGESGESSSNPAGEEG